MIQQRVATTLLLCLGCIVCMAAAVSQGSSSKSGNGAGGIDSQATTLATKDAAHIHKIKRQDKYQRSATTKQSDSAASASMMGSGTLPMLNVKRPKKNLTKSSHGLNKKLLNKMGFIKVKAPNSHNRKRLAVESRRHVSRDDSHMFIIKLPPNLNYYTSPNSEKNALPVAGAGPAPAATANAISAQANDNSPKSPTAKTATTTTATASATTPITTHGSATEASALTSNALKTNGKKVSFPFSSNGRPGRIYHWNLPVLKQALHKKPHFAHVSKADRNRLLDIEKIPTWRKPWENDTVEKSFNAGSGKSKYKKSLKPKSPTYYAPSQAVSKQSFHKYFAGNGKPKGFYVIKEHQTKPQFYQNIISQRATMPDSLLTLTGDSVVF